MGRSPCFSFRVVKFLSPLRKSQGCDRVRAFRIWDCAESGLRHGISGASFPNLVRTTEQPGPEGDIFVGAPFSWILALGRQEKYPGHGAEPRFIPHPILFRMIPGQAGMTEIDYLIARLLAAYISKPSLQQELRAVFIEGTVPVAAVRVLHAGRTPVDTRTVFEHPQSSRKPSGYDLQSPS